MSPSACATHPTASPGCSSVRQAYPVNSVLSLSNTSQSSVLKSTERMQLPSLSLVSTKNEQCVPLVKPLVKLEEASICVATKPVSKENCTSSYTTSLGRQDIHCKDINHEKINKAPATSMPTEDKDFSKLPFNSYSSVQTKSSTFLLHVSQRSLSQGTSLQASEAPSKSSANTNIHNSSKAIAEDMKIAALKQIFKDRALSVSPIGSIHDTTPKASTTTSVSKLNQVLNLQKKACATLHTKDLASSDASPVSPLGCVRSSTFGSSKLAVSLGGKDDTALSKIIAEAIKAAAEKPVLKGIDLNRVVRILIENGGMKSVKRESHK
ncbi:uncharacterized protein LOC128496921 [Spea bombifrons]|uniref:uncharacterized protein LOC128496921 n=1 Tax=Spea bombifrons TaxID=233779 RepID=UPI00234947B5|nr:uncharacterized protein LOC128496921 [Spea bombifrons]